MKRSSSLEGQQGASLAWHPSCAFCSDLDTHIYLNTRPAPPLKRLCIFLGGAAGALFTRLAPVLRVLQRPEYTPPPAQEAVHPDCILPASCCIVGVLSQNAVSDARWSRTSCLCFNSSLSPYVGLGGWCRHLDWCLQVPHKLHFLAKTGNSLQCLQVLLERLVIEEL